MSLSWLIRPEAEAEIAEAKDWYDEKRRGLGDDFLECVDATLERIRRNPESYAVIYKTLRRAMVRRYPYGIFYKITDTQIVVVGVIHARRRSSVWKSRA
jgi:plasmid stabilization system protein ParE